MRARIVNGIVAEVFPEVINGSPIEDCFHPDFIAALAACPDNVEPGWTCAEGVFAPPSGPSLTQAQAAKLAAIEAERDRRIALGVTVTFPDGQALVQTRDETDIRNASGIASSGLAMVVTGQAGTLVYRDAANVLHSMTPAQAIQFGFEVAAAIQAVYTQSWGAKAAVAALTTPGAVLGYDVVANWPSA